MDRQACAISHSYSYAMNFCHLSMTFPLQQYDVNVVGGYGGGGEYSVQVGFGWSNAVAMRLLDIYGDRLTATTGSSTQLSAISLLVILPLSFMTTLIASHCF